MISFPHFPPRLLSSFLLKISSASSSRLRFCPPLRSVSADDSSSSSNDNGDSLSPSEHPPHPQQRSRRSLRKCTSEKLPRGLRRYETTAVLRPDITEEERLEWTRRYEEVIIAGGAVSVEHSNRGLLPLTYSIKKKDVQGLAKTYLDGVYMHISYATKPESQFDLQKRLNADDDVIRTITVLLR